MNKRNVSEPIDNQIFEDVEQARNLPNLTEYYGYVLEVSNGIENGEDGVLIYVPGVDAADLIADEAKN